MPSDRRRRRVATLRGSIGLGAAALAAVMALALVGSAAAEPATPFRAPELCQAVGSNRTICFEAWGVSTLSTTPSGQQTVVSHAHRRFTEYTNAVLTFEQRDMSHRVIQLDGGEARVENYMFVGATGLCRFREHLIVREGEVVHSIDELACD